MKNTLVIALILLSATCYSQRSQFKNLFEKNDKIGIGTNQPDALLTVKGHIHTQEVLVDLKGAVAPDYVFENYFNGVSELKPNYEFATLAEVEEFIKKNHHLPGVPAGKELEKEGMLLKEMNLILLEKVEELTLYVIAQQKEIDTLKEMISTSKE